MFATSRRSILAFLLLLLVVAASSPAVLVFASEEQCVGEQCVNAEGVVTSDADAGERVASDADAGAAADADEDAPPPPAAAAAPEVQDPKCPGRDHVVRCAGKYLDANQNGLLERSELQSAIDGLPWYARGVLSILGSVDKVRA